jgi:hypothetical protein
MWHHRIVLQGKVGIRLTGLSMSTWPACTSTLLTTGHEFMTAVPEIPNVLEHSRMRVKSTLMSHKPNVLS